MYKYATHAGEPNTLHCFGKAALEKGDLLVQFSFRILNETSKSLKHESTKYISSRTMNVRGIVYQIRTNRKDLPDTSDPVLIDCSFLLPMAIQQCIALK